MEFFKEMLVEQYGEELTKKIFEGLHSKRKTTLRVNTIKTNVEKIKNELDRLQIKYKKVSWSKEALIIENADEKVLQETEIYKNGEIYLQSLSSMLPPIILEPKENEDILDMASAPGGKTTQIATLTNNKSHITACEKNKIRAEKLKYNIEKQGASSAFLMQKDARYLDKFFSFDQILLDAPCSGSGTLDLNNPNTEKYFTPELIKRTSKTQKELLCKAIELLKKGHTMVYSTCSILKKENEETLQKFIDKKKIEIEPINFVGIEEIPKLPTTIKGTLCICPTALYEGFYVAKIKKVF